MDEKRLCLMESKAVFFDKSLPVSDHRLGPREAAAQGSTPYHPDRRFGGLGIKKAAKSLSARWRLFDGLDE